MSSNQDGKDWWRKRYSCFETDFRGSVLRPSSFVLLVTTVCGIAPSVQRQTRQEASYVFFDQVAHAPEEFKVVAVRIGDVPLQYPALETKRNGARNFAAHAHEIGRASCRERVEK